MYIKKKNIKKKTKTSEQFTLLRTRGIYFLHLFDVKCWEQLNN